MAILLNLVKIIRADIRQVGARQHNRNKHIFQGVRGAGWPGIKSAITRHAYTLY